MRELLAFSVGDEVLHSAAVGDGMPAPAVGAVWDVGGEGHLFLGGVSES